MEKFAPDWKKLMRFQRPGVILLEAILGVAILAIFVTAIGTNLFQGIGSVQDMGERGRAVLYAEEGLEAVRNLRDAGSCCQASGTFFLGFASNRWSLSATTTDTFDIFSRSITVGVPNATTSRITSTVSWSRPNRGTSTVALATELTTWQQSLKGGLLVYGDSAVSLDTIRYRIYQSDGTWGSVQTVPSLGVPLNRELHSLRLYSSPTTNKKVLIAKFVETGAGDDQYIFATVWNGTSWGSAVKFASWSGTNRPYVRDFDGAYLANGDFLAVYDDETTIPKTALWNGTEWTTGTPTLDVGGNPEWIVVKARPNTSEAMVAIHDASDDINTLYWNGSTWGNLTEHGTASPGPQFEDIAFAWSPYTTANGALMFNEAGDNFPNIRIWNSTTWGADIENIDFRAQTRSFALSAHPLSSRFLGCVKDSSDDINCATSDITPSWTGTSPTEIATGSDGGAQRPFDLSYEARSGTYALVVYANGSNAAARALPKYRLYNPVTGAFGSEQALADLGGSAASLETVRLVPDPNSDTIMVLLGATNQTVFSQVWNGSTHAFYTTGDQGLTQHGSNGLADEDYWFDFGWDP